MADNDGFLSRWSRRKVQVQQGLPVPPAPEPQPATRAETLGAPVLALADPAVPAALAEPTIATAPAPPTAPQPPPPTMEEALQLTSADDFSRFVGRGVDPQVKNTALKTLFSDPHFNVMDGLDTYIDDYNKPDPLPPGMLRQMVQSTMLGLFDDEPADPAATDAARPALPAPAPAPAEHPAPAPAAATPTEPLPLHEDPAVRLQPNDDAGPAGDQPGLVEDPGRQQ